MMPLLGFTLFVVIFGVVTSQNHNVNLQAPYKEMTRKRSVEATTLIPPDPHVEDPGMRHLLSRLESLCMERLEYLITDTNSRFLSLENQSSVVHSTVNNIGDNLEANNKKMDNLEGKMENLGKTLHELMDITRNLSSDMQAIKQDDSCLINVTRSLMDFSSNSELKQIFNKGLPELKDLQTSSSTACPTNLTLDKQYPRNCREVQRSGKSASGTYMIQPRYGSKVFEVVCDLETRGGGWTVIQRRFDGSQDFHLGWEDYKNGFGNLEGELWLGLENIHLITGFEINELLIEMGDFESHNKSVFYSDFSIGSEMEGYYLKVLGDYSGVVGDGLRNSFGKKFSTIDKDQDDTRQFDLANIYYGGGWYSISDYNNLNGKYYTSSQISDNEYIQHSYKIVWFNSNAFHYPLKHTRMLVRSKI